MGLPSRVTKGSLYAGCIHNIYQRVGFLMSRQTLDSKSPGEGDQRVGRKGPCSTSTGAVFFPPTGRCWLWDKCKIPLTFNAWMPLLGRKRVIFERRYICQTLFFGYLFEISRGYYGSWFQKWREGHAVGKSLTEWWLRWPNEETTVHGSGDIYSTYYTSLNFNIPPENGLPKRKLVFQPSVLVSRRVCKIMWILHIYLCIHVYL